MTGTCTIGLTSMAVDDHHKGERFYLVHGLYYVCYILVGLVPSDLPRRLSRSEEQNHCCVIFDSYFAYGLAFAESTDTPRWFSPLDVHHQG